MGIMRVEHHELDGHWTIILSSGRCDEDAMEDWAIVWTFPAIGELPDSVRVDTNRTVMPGDAIYVIGYYGGGADEISFEEAVELSPIVVKATAVETPRNEPFDTSRLIYADAPADQVYRGISGGAAVVFDDERREWVIVGIYRGMSIRERHSLGLVHWRDRAHHIVVRFPMPADEPANPR